VGDVWGDNRPEVKKGEYGERVWNMVGGVAPKQKAGAI
jgi:hypothetical protein